MLRGAENATLFQRLSLSNQQLPFGPGTQLSQLLPGRLTRFDAHLNIVEWTRCDTHREVDIRVGHEF